jgi:hypothetical protein
LTTHFLASYPWSLKIHWLSHLPDALSKSHNPTAQAAPAAPANKAPISITPVGITIAAAPPVLEEVVPRVGVEVTVVAAVTPDVKGGAVAEEAPLKATDVLLGFG